MSLLDMMKYSIESLSTGERVLGSLQVTLLGVGIVFTALLFLYLTIVIMDKVLNKPEAKPAPKVQEPLSQVKEIVEEESAEEESVDDTELVAVITAAVAASLNTSTHNIIVRNIVRTSDATPAWGRMGRIEQINRMM